MLLISRLRPITQIGHRAILARDWSFSGTFNTCSLLIKTNCQILSTFSLICKEKLFIHKILIHVYCKNWKVFFSQSLLYWVKWHYFNWKIHPCTKWNMYCCIDFIRICTRLTGQLKAFIKLEFDMNCSKYIYMYLPIYA